MVVADVDVVEGRVAVDTVVVVGATSGSEQAVIKQQLNTRRRRMERDDNGGPPLTQWHNDVAVLVGSVDLGTELFEEVDHPGGGMPVIVGPDRDDRHRR